MICSRMASEMQFEHIKKEPNRYLERVLQIMRQGIFEEKGRLKRASKESIKNQQLQQTFDIIGKREESDFICCSKEYETEKELTREDIYFHLPNAERTIVFFAECKRLPKPKKSKDNSHDYVTGLHSNGKSPCGGIERYKLGLHGRPAGKLRDYGVIGYVESRSVKFWEGTINMSLGSRYPKDSLLEPKIGLMDEYVSTHTYDCNVKGEFKMHHFLINLTQ